MPCRVVMDLKPIETKFSFSKREKSATLLCSFTGKYNSPHSIEIELLVTHRSGNRYLKDNVAGIEASIAAGNLLRITGTLHRLLYQDRNSGAEIDQLQVYAFDVSPCSETEPIFSSVQMEGGVQKVSNAEIFKDTGEYRKVTFNLFMSPDSEYDKESYLSLYVNGFNDVADRTERLNLKDKSHVIANGKLEATSFGPLCLKLYELSYAARQTND